MTRKILCLSGLIIFAALVSFWRVRPEISNRSKEKNPEPKAQGAQVSVSTPKKQEGVTVRDAILKAPNLAWKPLENGRTDRPDYRKAEVFRRLQPARVVHSRELVMNDRLVIEHLLETKG